MAGSSSLLDSEDDSPIAESESKREFGSMHPCFASYEYQLTTYDRKNSSTILNISYI